MAEEIRVVHALRMSSSTAATSCSVIVLDDWKWCGHDWNHWREMLPGHLAML